MATTSNQIKVNREEVRMLAIQIGVREAARKLGLNEDRVCKWSERGKWFPKPSHVNDSKTLVSTVSKPSQVLTDELADNERETKLSLSRYARTASKDSERLSVREAPYVKAVTDVASKVHKWEQKEQGSNIVVNVALLGVDPDTIRVSE